MEFKERASEAITAQIERFVDVTGQKLTPREVRIATFFFHEGGAFGMSYFREITGVKHG